MMQLPEHQCPKNPKHVWIGLEADCPYCALEAAKTDSDYVIRLRPDAFHELTEVLDDYYGMSRVQAGLDGRGERLARQIRKAIARADREHICIDDVQKEGSSGNMECPKCGETIEGLTALHHATEEWAVILGENGELDYDYLTTWHDGRPLEDDGDVIQCPECLEELTAEEALELLQGDLQEEGG